MSTAFSINSIFSDILHQGALSLALWLEHWISVHRVLDSNPIKDMGSLKQCIISYSCIFIFVQVKCVFNFYSYHQYVKKKSSISTTKLQFSPDINM